MLISYKRGQNSVILRIKINDSSKSDNSGVTGLVNSTTNLAISAIADNESTSTIYTSAASHIQSITTLGTFAAPSASSCRFKEVDATNHPGVYEIQLPDTRYSISNAKSLLVTLLAITVSNVAQTDFTIPLVDLDPYQDLPTNFASMSIDSSGRVASILSDGVAHAGSTATLALQSINLINPSGDALYLASSSGYDINLAGSHSIKGNLIGGVAYVNNIYNTAFLMNVTTPSISDYIINIALQSDGRIIACGSANNIFAIGRYNINGTPDLSFGTSGYNVSTPGTNDAIDSVAIQSNGKIVGGGYSNNTFALVQYNIDGSLDTSFGTSGFNITSPGTSDAIDSIAIQSNGKIVVGGYANDTFALARYNSDGNLDTSFGTSGYNLSTPGTGDYINSVLIQSDGKILIGGVATITGSHVFALARYNDDGSLDTFFGTSGYNTVTPGTNDHLNYIALQSTGKIIGVGRAVIGGNQVFVVARYNINGSLDTSFATSGYNTVTPGTNDSITSVVIQSDDKIVVSGSVTIAGNSTFAIARYDVNGSLDTSFGVSGYIISAMGTGDSITSVVIQPDDKIIAGGYATVRGTTAFAITRYNADGTMDSFESYPDNFTSLVISESGFVTVGTNNDKTGYAVSDKTGYSLTQAFPSNFDSLVISGSGFVTIGTNNDKTGYALTQGFPTHFASTSIDTSGRVASILSDAVTHGGSTATLALQSMDITNPSGNAINAVSASGIGFNIAGSTHDIVLSGTGSLWDSVGSTRVLTSLDYTSVIPTTNDPNTLGDTLNAARAQAFGNWAIDSDNRLLRIYAPDGTTVLATFLLDSITKPTSRTAQ